MVVVVADEESKLAAAVVPKLNPEILLLQQQSRYTN
jgi:hypothetical protein